MSRASFNYESRHSGGTLGLAVAPSCLPMLQHEATDLLTYETLLSIFSAKNKTRNLVPFAGAVAKRGIYGALFDLGTDALWPYFAKCVTV